MSLSISPPSATDAATTPVPSPLIDSHLDMDEDPIDLDTSSSVAAAPSKETLQVGVPRISVPGSSVVGSVSSVSEPTATTTTPTTTPPVSVITPKASSSSNSSSRDSSQEKVGRWTEEEHQVFLAGLEQHGKQWKVIAGMIGTRTVVQVRTHAQKYFQRVERHSDSGSGAVMKTQGGNAHKRKMSLPASLPSQVAKKVKGSLSKKTPIQRAASISMIPANKSPSPTMQTFPSYVSNASSLSSTNSWDTFSPTAVADSNDCYDIFQQATSVKDSTEDIYDFGAFGQDPLEWLVDAEPSILPESSLPVFPDLSTGDVDQQGELHVVEDATSEGSSDYVMIEESILSNIADPNISVQSLFLPPSLLE